MSYRRERSQQGNDEYCTRPSQGIFRIQR
uniref:Uncharacterized protein n=1 Tax=Arundo donax TaxID=35708 RepID=A0A0A9ESS6_ARUDO